MGPTASPANFDTLTFITGGTQGTTSQTLASLTIGTGTTVTFGDGLPFASGPEKFGAPAALVPEPGSLALHMVCALGMLGRRRRAA